MHHHALAATHLPYRIIHCYLQRWHRAPLPEPVKPNGTWFSNPGGMQGWVDLVGIVTYRGGIRTEDAVIHPSTNRGRRKSNFDQRHYRATAKPATMHHTFSCDIYIRVYERRVEIRWWERCYAPVHRDPLDSCSISATLSCIPQPAAPAYRPPASQLSSLISHQFIVLNLFGQPRLSGV